ncbi:hypothetical protein E3N88_22850 [Mikania micrantha]|uniref:Uncharacterized protein n=1 Tax=Mikania micrantha TaxID=192012 RepID=A0A5N6NCN8_9ASTR|nr:hypothetical protein E3N88_22850 [Mikania micrantha]
MIFFKRHRPRSRRKCDIEVPAAVGQNCSTAVLGNVYDYDGLNYLNHVMPVDYVSPVEEVLYMYEPVNFGLSVEVSCIYTSLSTSGRQLRCLVLHKPVDFRSTVEANVLCIMMSIEELKWKTRSQDGLQKTMSSKQKNFTANLQSLVIVPSATDVCSRLESATSIIWFPLSPLGIGCCCLPSLSFCYLTAAVCYG